MATKKQKREAALAKRQRFEEELARTNAQNLERAKEARAARKEEDKRANEEMERRLATLKATHMLHSASEQAKR